VALYLIKTRQSGGELHTPTIRSALENSINAKFGE
jgi:hypothetical protein